MLFAGSRACVEEGDATASHGGAADIAIMLPQVIHGLLQKHPLEFVEFCTLNAALIT